MEERLRNLGTIYPTGAAVAVSRSFSEVRAMVEGTPYRTQHPTLKDESNIAQ